MNSNSDEKTSEYQNYVTEYIARCVVVKYA